MRCLELVVGISRSERLGDFLFLNYSLLQAREKLWTSSHLMAQMSLREYYSWMTSQSVFMNWSKAKRRVNAVAVSTLLAPAIAGAEILSPMEPQSLEPGDLLSYPVTFAAPETSRLQLRVESGPVGARLTVDPAGQVLIIWQSPTELAAEINIDLVARNVDTGEKLESRALLVRAAGPIIEVESLGALLGPFDEQEFPAGDPWEWVFAVDPKEVQLSAGGLPPGAMFMNDPEKGYVIRWTPNVEQQGRYEVNLQAVDRYNRAKVTNSSMLLQVKPEEVPDTFVDPDVPTILPLANQVVSAGRIVSFKVKSNAEDGTVPVLLVDRIPRDASFDGNEDGSRTFFWQTGDRDQGEHVFRFTAVNPREPNLRSFQDVLIIVGDPTRNKTAPQ